jgi:non-heme chloroperoxidase
LSAELLPDATLRVYEGYSHGMCTINADVINRDLLEFIRG